MKIEIAGAEEDRLRVRLEPHYDLAVAGVDMVAVDEDGNILLSLLNLSEDGIMLYGSCHGSGLPTDDIGHIRVTHE